jgi:hypothetical protein
VAVSPTPACDAGSIVIGWLVRVVVLLAVLFFGGFNGISIAVAHYDATNDAPAAAMAASSAYRAALDSTEPGMTPAGAAAAAVAAADGYARAHGDTVAAGSIRVSATGRVQLTLRRVARTVLLPDVQPFRGWRVATSSGSAESVG